MVSAASVWPGVSYHFDKLFYLPVHGDCSAERDCTSSPMDGVTRVMVTHVTACMSRPWWTVQGPGEAETCIKYIVSSARRMSGAGPEDMHTCEWM